MTNIFKKNAGGFCKKRVGKRWCRYLALFLVVVMLPTGTGQVSAGRVYAEEFVTEENLRGAAVTGSEEESAKETHPESKGESAKEALEGSEEDSQMQSKECMETVSGNDEPELVSSEEACTHEQPGGDENIFWKKGVCTGCGLHAVALAELPDGTILPLTTEAEFVTLFQRNTIEEATLTFWDNIVFQQSLSIIYSQTWDLNGYCVTMPANGNITVNNGLWQVDDQSKAANGKIVAANNSGNPTQVGVSVKPQGSVDWYGASLEGYVLVDGTFRLFGGLIDAGNGTATAPIRAQANPIGAVTSLPRNVEIYGGSLRGKMGEILTYINTYNLKFATGSGICAYKDSVQVALSQYATVSESTACTFTYKECTGHELADHYANGKCIYCGNLHANHDSNGANGSCSVCGFSGGEEAAAILATFQNEQGTLISFSDATGLYQFLSETLSEAGKLTLYGDINLASKVWNINRALEIDLNGHILIINGIVLDMYGSGTVVVLDSSINQEGLITNADPEDESFTLPSEYCSYLFTLNYGRVVVQSGEIRGKMIGGMYLSTGYSCLEVQRDAMISAEKDTAIFIDSNAYGAQVYVFGSLEGYCCIDDESGKQVAEDVPCGFTNNLFRGGVSKCPAIYNRRDMTSRRVSRMSEDYAVTQIVVDGAKLKSYKGGSSPSANRAVIYSKEGILSINNSSLKLDVWYWSGEGILFEGKLLSIKNTTIKLSGNGTLDYLIQTKGDSCIDGLTYEYVQSANSSDGVLTQGILIQGGDVSISNSTILSKEAAIAIGMEGSSHGSMDGNPVVTVYGGSYGTISRTNAVECNISGYRLILQGGTYYSQWVENPENPISQEGVHGGIFAVDFSLSKFQYASTRYVDGYYFNGGELYIPEGYVCYNEEHQAIPRKSGNILSLDNRTRNYETWYSDGLYDPSLKKVVIGAEEGHNYQNGVCINCGEAHDHQFNQATYTCSGCGLSVAAVYTDGEGNQFYIGDADSLRTRMDSDSYYFAGSLVMYKDILFSDYTDSTVRDSENPETLYLGNLKLDLNGHKLDIPKELYLQGIFEVTDTSEEKKGVLNLGQNHITRNHEDALFRLSGGTVTGDAVYGPSAQEAALIYYCDVEILDGVLDASDRQFSIAGDLTYEDSTYEIMVKKGSIRGMIYAGCDHIILAGGEIRGINKPAILFHTASCSLNICGGKISVEKDENATASSIPLIAPDNSVNMDDITITIPAQLSYSVSPESYGESISAETAVTALKQLALDVLKSTSSLSFSVSECEHKKTDPEQEGSYISAVEDGYCSICNTRIGCDHRWVQNICEKCSETAKAKVTTASGEEILFASGEELSYAYGMRELMGTHTLTLLGDVTIPDWLDLEYLGMDRAEIVWDLNGHNLSLTIGGGSAKENALYYAVLIESDFTIRDSAGGSGQVLVQFPESDTYEGYAGALSDDEYMTLIHDDSSYYDGEKSTIQIEGGVTFRLPGDCRLIDNDNSLILTECTISHVDPSEETQLCDTSVYENFVAWNKTTIAPGYEPFLIVEGEQIETTLEDLTSPYYYSSGVSTIQIRAHENHEYFVGKCTVCGYSHQNDSDHELVFHAGSEATCTRAGKTAGTYCDICGFGDGLAVRIPAKGHSISVTKGYAATCTVAGKTDTVGCSVCGLVGSSAVDIPAKGHNTRRISGKNPTCTEDGLTAGAVCITCGVTTKEQTVLTKTGHAMNNDTYVAPTCTADGYSGYGVCVHCGITVEESEASAIPALGHITIETIAAQASTCTVKGHSAQISCDRCKTVLEPSRELDLAPHSKYTSKAAKAATCTEDGWTIEETCSKCRNVVTASRRVSSNGGHNLVATGTAKAATCTEEGYSVGYRCSRCGYTQGSGAVIPMKGHSYVVTSTRAATTTSLGYTFYECVNCHAKKTETSPKLPKEDTKPDSGNGTGSGDGSAGGSGSNDGGSGGSGSNDGGSGGSGSNDGGSGGSGSGDGGSGGSGSNDGGSGGSGSNDGGSGGSGSNDSGSGGSGSGDGGSGGSGSGDGSSGETDQPTNPSKDEEEEEELVIPTGSYAIIYDGNGASSGNMAETIVKVNKSVTLRKNVFKRTGYTFAGWNTKANGKGKSYKDKASVKKLAKSGKTITLYAQWTANTYTVKFSANKGKGTMKAKSYKYGKAYKLPKNLFTRKGYTFKGWNTKANGKGTAFNNLASVKNLVSKNKGKVTLYAQWKKK